MQINDKDLKDGMLLLLAAQVGDTDKDMINAKYVAKLMSDDWGFYYTSTMNLEKIKSASSSVAVLTDHHRSTIAQKADQIIQAIENAPKSGKWKGRAKVGTKKPWYNEVSDWA